MYKFRLTVADGKGLKGNDDVVLTVKEGMRLVSMHLLLNVACFFFLSVKIYNFV